MVDRFRFENALRRWFGAAGADAGSGANSSSFETDGRQGHSSKEISPLDDFARPRNLDFAKGPPSACENGLFRKRRVGLTTLRA
jgi:hypothetical protein